MADRSNFGEFLENDRLKPEDSVHEDLICNNNDIGAVDLNSNNDNNNNESYCSEAQCFSRRGRISTPTKDIATEGHAARRQRERQNSMKENFAACSTSESTERKVHSTCSRDVRLKKQTLTGPLFPDDKTSNNQRRKPSSEDFFCSETGNILPTVRVQRDNFLHKQFDSLSTENVCHRFGPFGNYCEERDDEENFSRFLSSENTHSEKRKPGREVLDSSCFGGIDDERGYKHSNLAMPDSRKYFCSNSRYEEGEISNPDSCTRFYGTETESAVFGLCEEFAENNHAKGFLEFSSQNSKSNSYNFSLNVIKTKPQNFYRSDEVESYCETPLESRANESIQFQRGSNVKAYPNDPNMFSSDIPSQDHASNCSKRFFRPSNLSNFANLTDDSFTHLEIRENDSFNNEQTDDNVSPCSSEESCRFQGECEVFECESCTHCSSETYSNSSYSDCGPECECRGHHSVPAELCDPATQIPEVRWTARLLGGDEKEVEAFKAKKIASMKK